MKPPWISDAVYYRLMTVGRQVVAEHPKETRLFQPPDELMVEMSAAGAWLMEEALADGASAEAAYDLSCAFGQAVCPRREPWATAKAILARRATGRAPRFGPEWGDELLEGDVSDLPPGGMRLVRRRLVADG
jgi:hypothetical protein